MLQDLLDEAAPIERPARRVVHDRRAAFLGALSIWLLVAAVVLQAVSLAQQFSYLFAPRPGELAIVIAVLATAVLVGIAGVVVGCMAATKPDGRRAGVFGSALGLGFLVLFGAASWFGWGFLGALSSPI